MITADDLVLITDPTDTLLHTPTDVVLDVPAVREYIPAMLALLRRTGSKALSANQVGRSDSVFVTNLTGDWPRVFINPSMECLGETELVYESCLSGKFMHIIQRKRHTRVIVCAYGIDDDQFVLDTGDGYYRNRPALGKEMAAVIQHEMEHLDGIDTVTGELLTP